MILLYLLFAAVAFVFWLLMVVTTYVLSFGAWVVLGVVVFAAKLIGLARRRPPPPPSRPVPQARWSNRR